MADKRNLEKTAIQWHPAFYGAAELELRDNKEDLEFHQEYNLSKEPLRVDLLVVEKLAGVQVRNEIGHIFRKYNVFEYKSPDDGLTIDDFYKTVGYACLYKGLGGTVDAVMDATVAANKGVYEKIRREDPFICEALRELMKDEIEEREREADEKARQEKSIELIRNLMETMKWTAEQAMEALKVPAKDRKKYMAGL